MKTRKLMFVAVAGVIAAAQWAGFDALLAGAQHAPRALAVPAEAIPVLPTIRVSPSAQDIAAAFAQPELAAAPAEQAMPFYSFATRPAAAGRG